MTTLNKIAAAARKALEIMAESGEQSFSELKKSEKTAIYDAFINSTDGIFTWDVDGDSDGYSAAYRIDPNDDHRIVFFSTAEYYEDMLDQLNSVRFEFYYEDAPDTTTDIQWFEYIANKFAGAMQVVNLTPLDVVIVDATGLEIKRYPISGQIARVKTVDVPLHSIDGISVVYTKYTDVEGLPDAHPNTVYLVSVHVAQALEWSRPDVYTPDTGPNSVVRTDQGQFVGVQRLMKLY